MTFSLTPELEKLVEAHIASGRFRTVDDVMHEALRLLESQEREVEKELAALRAQIQPGIEEAERGEFVDGEAVFAELREKSRQRRNGLK